VFLEIFQRKIHIKYKCSLILIILEVINLQHFLEFVFSKISDGRRTVWPGVERVFSKRIKWWRFQTGNIKIIDLHSFAFSFKFSGLHFGFATILNFIIIVFSIIFLRCTGKF
jgi:hypothetical protein